MAANQLVQARIDPAVKQEAAAVLAAMGLTVSVTIEAIKEARRGGLPRFASVQDLLDDLLADD